MVADQQMAAELGVLSVDGQAIAVDALEAVGHHILGIVGPVGHGRHTACLATPSGALAHRLLH